MNKAQPIIIISFFIFYVLCTKDMIVSTTHAEQIKKTSDLKKQRVPCESISAKIQSNKNYSTTLLIQRGKTNLDTITLEPQKIYPINEEEITLVDLNFDGFCDIVLLDILSANHGGVNHYYFLFDTRTQKYVPDHSIPKFIARYKLKTKSQLVKIYCPHDDCFAYYQYQESKKAFTKVRGTYEVNP